MAPSEAPRLYTDADGWVKLQIEGMGIASYDVTGDGYPDVFLTSQGASRLQTLTAGPSQPTFRDIGLPRGVNVAHPFTGDMNLPSTAWHPEFQDVNNDGFVDLFISKGNVSSIPDYAMKDPSDLLMGRPDGTFVEGAGEAGIVSFDRGRGAALADFNLDGLLDLVLVNHGAPVKLWRNVGSGTAAAPAAMGHWLAIRLGQTGANLDAIGSWVEVRVGDTTLRREITVGGGHVGGQLGWIALRRGSGGRGRRARPVAGRREGPWLHVSANGFYDSSGAPRRPAHGCRPGSHVQEALSGEGAASPGSISRISGCPRWNPGSRPPSCRSAMGEPDQGWVSQSRDPAGPTAGRPDVDPQPVMGRYRAPSTVRRAPRRRVAIRRCVVPGAVRKGRQVRHVTDLRRERPSTPRAPSRSGCALPRDACGGTP